jgi:hypothetical protein
LVLEPSVEDIQGVFIQSIDKMVAAFRSILTVDKEAMSLLTLDARVIMNIGAGDPLYSDLDVAVKQMKTRINNKVAAAMKGPMMLCKLYNEFAWLLEEDLEDYLDNFVISCDNGVPSRTDFQDELAKLALAKKQIQHLSFRYETFELVRVDTEGARSVLLERIDERHDGLGNLLATQVRALFSSTRAIALVTRTSHPPPSLCCAGPRAEPGDCRAVQGDFGPHRGEAVEREATRRPARLHRGVQKHDCPVASGDGRQPHVAGVA